MSNTTTFIGLGVAAAMVIVTVSAVIDGGEGRGAGRSEPAPYQPTAEEIEKIGSKRLNFDDYIAMHQNNDTVHVERFLDHRMVLYARKTTCADLRRHYEAGGFSEVPPDVRVECSDSDSDHLVWVIDNRSPRK